MKKLIKHAFIYFLPLAFLLTSCFEFKEKVEFNSDGSGSFQFTIDMGQIKQMLQMMESMAGEDEGEEGAEGEAAEEEKEDPMADMNKEFEDIIARLENIDGITNIKGIDDDEDFVFGYSFDFSNVGALNKAMFEIWNDDEENPIPAGTEFFKFSKNGFERAGLMGMKESLSQEMGEDGASIPIMQEMNWTTVYTFPKKIKNSSNDLSEISSDGKEVTVKYYFLKEGYEEKDINNKISF